MNGRGDVDRVLERLIGKIGHRLGDLLCPDLPCIADHAVRLKGGGAGLAGHRIGDRDGPALLALIVLSKAGNELGDTTDKAQEHGGAVAFGVVIIDRAGAASATEFIRADGGELNGNTIRT